MKLIHFSDLHFGTTQDRMVDTIVHDVLEKKPDLIIISGDFTQRASAEEFVQACKFIEKFSPLPVFCVPGNHDIPAFDLFSRLLTPYKLYKEYISTDLNPILSNEEVVISGINSARRALPHWNWANGMISQSQCNKVMNDFQNTSSNLWRICVVHHPVHFVDDMPLDVTVFGRKRAMHSFANAKVDLVLTGHVHHASVVELEQNGYKTIYVSASTALSSRTRKQENGYNLIELNNENIKITHYEFKKERFGYLKEFIFTRSL